MSILITALIILICLLLIVVVLIQNSKGGGLSSQFAGSNQLMGVRRTSDFLEKATYTLALALLLMSLLSSATISKGSVAAEAPESKTSEVKQNTLNFPAGTQKGLVLPNQTAAPKTPAPVADPNKKK
jgi:preprotein translocase subunit SecG